MHLILRHENALSVYDMYSWALGFATGLEDKAAHSYQGKRTERNEAMFMMPGTAYVYNIYGVYCCFNISSAGIRYSLLISLSI